VGTTHQGMPGGPDGWWPTRSSPPPPICSINTLKSRKPSGSRRNTIPAVASSKTTRSKW
jgi:hypothetical protein